MKFTRHTLTNMCISIPSSDITNSTPRFIIHDGGFAGSEFHSSSLQRLCFKQGLAGNTIALRTCELLLGELMFMMIIRSDFLGDLGSVCVF